MPIITTSRCSYTQSKDISINISKFYRDEAVDTICKTALLERFKTTAKSRKAMDALLIAVETEEKNNTKHVLLIIFPP